MSVLFLLCIHGGMGVLVGKGYKGKKGNFQCPNFCYRCPNFCCRLGPILMAKFFSNLPSKLTELDVSNQTAVLVLFSLAYHGRNGGFGWQKRAKKIKAISNDLKIILIFVTGWVPK